MRISWTEVAYDSLQSRLYSRRFQDVRESFILLKTSKLSIFPRPSQLSIFQSFKELRDLESIEKSSQPLTVARNYILMEFARTISDSRRTLNCSGLNEKNAANRLRMKSICSLFDIMLYILYGMEDCRESHESLLVIILIKFLLCPIKCGHFIA